MISRLKASLLVLTTLAAISFASLAQAQTVTTQPVPVKPAMWVIKDADSTIYLLGSIHVMKPETPWLNPAIQSRFDSAQDVWFEIPDLDNKAAAMPVAQKYMFDPQGDVASGLSPEEVAQVNDLLKPLNLNTTMLKAMRKWAVGLIITMQQVNQLGYATDTGVDLTLVKQARDANKGVHGLETMEAQMQALVPETEEDELTNLRATLTDIETMPQDLDDLFAAWKAGDTEALGHLMIDKMQAEDPKNYQRLIVGRNAAWEPKIEAILAGKGTTFITVGAGHLVGPDSVIAMLKAHGIRAERINY
ncbi:MAG: TraB/GumN family protein [Asticcacaulis sp.]|uniref:TraB/GumN family protein n=1 Tax=Asticcacaulis sp. TaxID=1872648 RepID=UPI0039E3D49A